MRREPRLGEITDVIKQVANTVPNLPRRHIFAEANNSAGL